MSKRAREVHINVQLTTTVSNTWLSCYLVIDQTLGTLQVLVHIVTVTVKKKFADWTKRKYLLTQKFFMQIIFNVKISQSMVYTMK